LEASSGFSGIVSKGILSSSISPITRRPSNMFFRVGVEPSLLKMNVKVIKFYTFYNPKKLIFYQLNARVAQYMAGKRPLKFWT
jgi:hypothetical protein